MDILNINSYYYSSTVHKEMRNYLIEHKVDSLTYVPLCKGYVPRVECQYAPEANVIHSNCYNNIDKYIFTLKNKKIVDDIVRHDIKFDQYKCAHAHSLFSNGVIALKIKNKYALPYVVTVRDTDLNIFFRYRVNLRKIGITIIENASAVVFLSKPYKNKLIGSYIDESTKEIVEKKSYVLPNGIDRFWFANKKTPKKLTSNSIIRLVFVGAITKRKNIATIIKVVELLNKSNISTQLVVIGRIIDKSQKNIIMQNEYIEYHDYMPKEMLIKIYERCDIFIMPSIRESFGLVYAEAMSQGIPVIYTRNQGFDGQFNDGDVGYSVNCFDINEIADKVVDITKNYEKLSKGALDRVEKYNWHVIAEEYKQIYSNVCSN